MTNNGRVLAWLMAAPAVAAAVALIGMEGWRLRAPDSPLFSTPFAYSLAEAIERDDAARAFAYLRAGQDPNTPIAVRHSVLTGDRQILLSPMLWAVAANAQQSVLMLLGHGVRLDALTGRGAFCIALALERSETVMLLERYVTAPPADACPATPTRGEMVLAFAATP